VQRLNLRLTERVSHFERLNRAQLSFLQLTIRLIQDSVLRFLNAYNATLKVVPVRERHAIVLSCGAHTRIPPQQIRQIRWASHFRYRGLQHNTPTSMFDTRLVAHRSMQHNQHYKCGSLVAPLLQVVKTQEHLTKNAASTQKQRKKKTKKKTNKGRQYIGVRCPFTLADYIVHPSTYLNGYTQRER